MVSREDWIVGGIFVAILAAMGITVFVLSRKKKPEYTLRRVQGKQTVLTNLEQVKVVRDREGNLSELIIHRTVESE